MSIAILPEDKPENRSRRDRRRRDLSEECEGLPFDYRRHEGVDGPDAELVHFPPTRRELKLLAAQYLERRFFEERSIALGYPQCAEDAALIERQRVSGQTSAP